MIPLTVVAYQFWHAVIRLNVYVDILEKISAINILASRENDWRIEGGQL